MAGYIPLERTQHMNKIDNSRINLRDAFLRFEQKAETLDLKIN